METSAPKRRRTSPRTSVPVNPEPHAEAEAESTTPQEPVPEPAAASKRPSFASPTKASLERHNPEIAQRRRTRSPPKRGPSNHHAVPASQPAGGGGNLMRREDSLGARPVPSRQDEDSQRALRGAELSQGQSVLRSPARRLGRPSRTSQLRPLPPPVAEDDEEILDPFARRGLRRSPAPGVLPEVVVPEPELPPTPEHPDPVVSTPPSGIHNTPSRRPRRSKALAERLKSSSPLKVATTTSSPSQRDAPPPVFKLPPKPSKARARSHSAESQGPTTAVLRGFEPDDPDAEKKKQRDALLAEIAELERDLRIASAENERLLSKTAPSRPRDANEILDLLQRHTLPPEKESETAPWLASALDPIAFLPFAKPTSRPPILFTDASKEDDQPAPISHHPLSMTAEEALPYLRAFTPLTFSSHIATLPLPEHAPDAHLLQKHIISVGSSAPRGLFAARIEMTVDTRFMSITELEVPKIDPSAAAELAPFIDDVTTSTSSGLGKNICVLAWAMGEWVRLATQRAKVWCVLESELGSGREAIREMVERTRARRRRKKRRERGADEESSDEEESEKDGGKTGTVELLPFMGRTSMDFEVPVLVGGEDASSMLRVQWKIGFDWTGEGSSELRVLVGVPGKWYKHDERGRLSGISGLFDDLIRGGEDPLTAVRTVACLLAGKEKS
ncbi:hypothetical protein OQA88_8234 [Cercophora sp. LCS_1]